MTTSTAAAQNAIAQSTTVTIHADGACSGNPGPGGWAWEILDSDGALICEDAGADPEATNNKMELHACAEALAALLGALLGAEKDAKGARIAHALLRLDSEYVVKGCRDWLPNWKANGWRTAARKPVANDVIWKRIDILMISLSDAGVTLGFEWVKGHSGDGGNERVDSKAYAMSQDLRAQIAAGGASTSSSPTSSASTSSASSGAASGAASVVAAASVAAPTDEDQFRAGFEAAARAAMRFRPDLAQGFSEAEIIAMLTAIHVTRSAGQ